nr:MAG TPA: hypothetical protein [Caudoviricetes sp.]
MSPLTAALAKSKRFLRSKSLWDESDLTLTMFCINILSSSLYWIKYRIAYASPMLELIILNPILRKLYTTEIYSLLRSE